MAKIIGIYNNKGGVGKTTLTIFLADFLSSVSINGKKSKVLVIDFDPQASCAVALLGEESVEKIRKEKKTLSAAFAMQLWKKEEPEFQKYIHSREEQSEKRKTRGRKFTIGALDVMVSGEDDVLNFDENASLKDSLYCAALLDRRLGKAYDFIFVDFPGNLSKVNKFSLIGAFLVKSFIIPLEANKLTVNAVPSTIKMLDNISKWRGDSKKKPGHSLLGFVLNKTDRRTKQYKLHYHRLQEIAEQRKSKIYKSILPQTPKLATAADDSLSFITLAEKYDTYYGHVRRFVVEIMEDLGFRKDAGRKK